MASLTSSGSRRRPRPGQPPSNPKAMAAAASATPREADTVLASLRPARLGFLMRKARYTGMWKSEAQKLHYYELRGAVLLVWKEPTFGPADISHDAMKQLYLDAGGSSSGRPLSHSHNRNHESRTTMVSSYSSMTALTSHSTRSINSSSSGKSSSSVDGTSSRSSNHRVGWTSVFDLGKPGTVISEEPGQSQRGRHAFSIKLPAGAEGGKTGGKAGGDGSSSSGSSGSRTITLAASTAVEKQRWVAALMLAARRRVTVDDFKLHSVIGQGNFGRVLLVSRKIKQKSEKEGKEEEVELLAMKEIKLLHKYKPKVLINERNVLGALPRSDFVVSLRTAFREGGFLYYGFEFCAGGDMFELLRRGRRTGAAAEAAAALEAAAEARRAALARGGGRAGAAAAAAAAKKASSAGLGTQQLLDRKAIAFYAAEVALGLQHLHKHKILHRDIKPENVLVDAYGHVKLGDLGLAKRLKRPDNSSSADYSLNSSSSSASSEGGKWGTKGGAAGAAAAAVAAKRKLEPDPERTFTMCGTKVYLAPEVFTGRGYGLDADFWQFGCFVFELYMGHSPFWRPQGMPMSAATAAALATAARGGARGSGGRRVDSTAALIMAGEYSYRGKAVDKEAKQLIAQLLQVRTGKRMTSWREVQRSSFFDGVLNWKDAKSRSLTPPLLPQQTLLQQQQQQQAQQQGGEGGQEEVTVAVGNFDAKFTEKPAVWGAKEPCNAVLGSKRGSKHDFTQLFTEELLGFDLTRGRGGGGGGGGDESEDEEDYTGLVDFEQEDDDEEDEAEEEEQVGAEMEEEEEEDEAAWVRLEREDEELVQEEEEEEEEEEQLGIDFEQQQRTRSLLLSSSASEMPPPMMPMSRDRDMNTQLMVSRGGGSTLTLSREESLLSMAAEDAFSPSSSFVTMHGGIMF